MYRFFCILCVLVTAGHLAGNAGCSRQFYRTKADREVYSVIQQGNNDPRWRVDNYNIKPDAASRMHDPFHPDKEPMPPDDSAAHRKMRNVDGKKGSKDWYDHGCTRHAENPYWRQFLFVNEKGEIPLDKDKAVQLARLHAPEYQSNLESLYLAAMGVSQERFRYDVQFFGGDSLTYRNAGSNVPNSGATLSNRANLGAEKAMAAGGTWIVDLANNVTWSLTGSGSFQPSTVLNVGITQPLLRGASRKVVLEQLTQTERDFLAELRKMVLFQQGHYTRIVTGTVPRISGVSVAGAGGGFYRLLAEQIQIQNQRQNIIGLEENLNRLSAMYDAGQVGNIAQVEEMRQSLLTAQSRLLEQINRYQSSVESYISSLGLPPDLRVSINDPLLEQFQLSSPTLTTLQEDVADILSVLRQENMPTHNNLSEKTQSVIRRTEGEIAILKHDLETLTQSMPVRITSLKNLEAILADRIASGERIAKTIYDADEFEQRIVLLRTRDIPRNLSRLQASFTLLNLIAHTESSALREMILNRTFDMPVQDALRLLELSELAGVNADGNVQARREFEETEEQLDALRTELGIEANQNSSYEARRMIAKLRQRDPYRDWVHRVFSVFQYELISLSLMQTRARLDAMTLPPVAVTPEEAFRIASENRLDWMNQKSQLVDAWRQIDIRADRLKGVLDLTFDGSLRTSGRSGTEFNKNNSDLSLGLRWDTPLTRYNEMMAYRSSQIDYQKARRDYYTYVDSVQSDLRNVLRDVQMSQINFEINRNAVLVGTTRVDVMQLQMEQPPARGGRIDTSVADQLIRALEGLMRSQNDFLNSWVAHQTQRILLDLYMGTMSLDTQGRWIDPGVLGMRDAVQGNVRVPELAPPPIPVPVIESSRLNRRYVH